MIKYRDIDFDKDVPEIISLLRTSLSEKHTVTSFLWQHYDNPFGKSYGLLACDNDKIIGARMFMFWEFQLKEETIKAIRPVDTITHPDYRGKGIFKNLTLKGLENCQGRYDLIFNTPNQSSFPGYLKMGWKEVNNNPLFKLGIVGPENFADFSCKEIEANQIKGEELNGDPYFFQTKHTESFIHWRYSPIDYKIARITFNGIIVIIIYRLIKIKGFKCIVLIEVFGKTSLQNRAVKFLCFTKRAFLIYYLHDDQSKLSFPLSIKRKFPVIVFKEDKTGIGEKIKFSAGDLEGRL